MKKTILTITVLVAMTQSSMARDEYDKTPDFTYQPTTNPIKP